MKSIKGVLFDLDGVFYVGDKLISGGNETLAWLRAQDIGYRFVTNNTTLSRSALVAKLQHLGLNISENELLSANYAGVLQLQKMGLTRCRLVLAEAAQADYPPAVEDDPEAIVVGDIGNDWDYDLLNRHSYHLIQDFYLFDGGKTLVYRGQMDSSRPKNDLPVTGKDLRAALDSLLTGKTIDTLQKPSLGCNIKWKV